MPQRTGQPIARPLEGALRDRASRRRPIVDERSVSPISQYRYRSRVQPHQMLRKFLICSYRGIASERGLSSRRSDKLTSPIFLTRPTVCSYLADAPLSPSSQKYAPTSLHAPASHRRWPRKEKGALRRAPLRRVGSERSAPPACPDRIAQRTCPPPRRSPRSLAARAAPPRRQAPTDLCR
jgi:hypothetical protein